MFGSGVPHVSGRNHRGPVWELSGHAAVDRARDRVMDDETVLTDMAALLDDVRAPALLAGRYRLHHLLGTGGMADVHEATDTRLDRRVAVKLLREVAASETDRARFLSEARLLGRLSHPHLVGVLDAGIDDERPFLVLQLVRGRTLSQALGEPLPPSRVARLGADIAAALEHVHAAGVVHRDVKPGNVLVDEDGSARLADFGIARVVDETHHHTRTGTVMGTIAYLAPEQVAGEPVTTAVDIYALGLVLLEALTGARPYAGTSVESALARLHRPPELPATLPPQWAALLAAMTARDPAARPTAAQVAARLRAGLPAPARPVTSHQLSPRVALIGVAAAFALLLGTAAWSSIPLPSRAPAASAAHHASAAAMATVKAPRHRSVAAPAVVPAAAPPAPARHATVVHHPRPHRRHAIHHRSVHHRSHHHRRPHGRHGHRHHRR
jgi:eukaryotic-like serine/threonine-protein kinase